MSNSSSTGTRQALALAAITLAVFSVTLGADFVYDSRLQILTSPFIHDSANWLNVLTLRVLGMDVLDFNRPVQLASLMLDATFWRRNPFGFHLSSVLLHVANTLLVWAVIRRHIWCSHARAGRAQACGRLGKPANAPEATPGTGVATTKGPTTTSDDLWPAAAAFLAALVFAVHPVMAEAVCEPAYREDLLATFFSLGALLLAMGHNPAAGRDPWRVLACAGACFLAVASKETGVAAPFLIGGYGLLYRRGEARGFWRLCIGAALLATAGFLAARFLLEPEQSAIFEAKPSYPGGSLGSALVIQTRLSAFYAQLVVWPGNLCADYGPYSIRYIPFGVALTVLIVLALLAIVAAWRDRRLPMAYLLVLLPLLPVSNLVPIYRAAADRYLYFPMAGVALTLACLLSASWLRSRLRERAVIAAMAAIALLGFVCVGRQQVWANSLELWADATRKNPLSATAVSGLAEALRKAGRWQEAERAARAAIKLNPERGSYQATLALILNGAGRTAEANEALKKALELDPRLANPDARVAVLSLEREEADDLKRLLR